MDWDERAELSHSDESYLWMHKATARQPEIEKWISGYRDGLPCKITNELCGSFNWCYVLEFEDGVRWLLRFPVPGRVMSIDEKVRNEVAIMSFIKQKTSIPIPDIITWGVSSEMELGLGAFILMNFVEGIPLKDFLEEKRPNGSRPMLRPDVDMGALETLYRQVARFLLELSKHDLPSIGSLTRVDDQYLTQQRPLMIKMNEIESHGGVKLTSVEPATFGTATDFFNYIADQDLQHLTEQPNSIDDEADARSKYRCSQTLRKLIPRFVTQKHDKGPFKLYCEDFRLGNMLVNNYDELRIVAVFDWEWSWAAPLQLFCSPPRWLLLRQPIRWDRSQQPDPAERYATLLQLFLRVLQEEEEGNTGFISGSGSVSSLMRSGMEDGKFWFHELVLSCFEGPQNAAWQAIRDLIPGTEEALSIPQDELDAFVAAKLQALAVYEKDWAAVQHERKTLLAQLNSQE